MSKKHTNKKPLDDAQLLLMAEKELLGEAKRAAVRYSQAGPSGWMPCPLPKANKVFLVNTISSTISSNKRKEVKPSMTKIKFRERKMFRGRKSSGHCSDNIVFRQPSKKVVSSPSAKQTAEPTSKGTCKSSNKPK